VDAEGGEVKAEKETMTYFTTWDTNAMITTRFDTTPNKDLMKKGKRVASKKEGRRAGRKGKK
jgi:hypothetical protein